jgi:mannose-6-phosphate isomerase-like protein (cupin superfamily)
MPAQLLGPGEGETIRPGFEIKVGRPELVLTEVVFPEGQAGPDPHVHHHHSDGFWIFEGQLQFDVGPELAQRTLGAGSFVLVPPDVLHSFRNPGPGEAHYLNIHAPGCGFDEYIRSGFQAPFDQHYEPAGTGRPASEVTVLEAGEGERLEIGATVATIKAGVDQIGVFDATVAPDFPRPPAHRHARMLESIYVIEGALALTIDGDDATIPAGGFVAIPPGTVHTSSPGQEPVRFLNLIAPGGMEHYLREAARLGAPPEPTGFDIEFV